jgi:valyl-tRNA synthetase
LEATAVEEARTTVTAIYNTVRAGRNLRAESRVPSNKKTAFVLRSSYAWIAAELPTIARLLNAEPLTIDENFAPPSGVPVAATDIGELYLLTAAAADPAAERERLDKEIGKLEKDLEATARKLANSSFVDNAPREVVEEHRQRKAMFGEKLAQLRAARAALE